MNAGRFPKVLYFPITNLPVGVLLKARPQNRLLLLENIIVNQKCQHDRIPRLTCNRPFIKNNTSQVSVYSSMIYLLKKFVRCLCFVFFAVILSDKQYAGRIQYQVNCRIQHHAN